MKLVCFCRFAKTFETRKVATLPDVNGDGSWAERGRSLGTRPVNRSAVSARSVPITVNAHILVFTIRNISIESDKIHNCRFPQNLMDGYAQMNHELISPQKSALCPRQFPSNHVLALGMNIIKPYGCFRPRNTYDQSTGHPP
jgi:hypothetical protein